MELSILDDVLGKFSQSDKVQITLTPTPQKRSKPILVTSFDLIFCVNPANCDLKTMVHVWLSKLHIPHINILFNKMQISKLGVLKYMNIF